MFDAGYPPPQAFTRPPSAVKSSYAVVRGRAIDRGLPAVWRFKWGLTASYGQITEAPETYVLNGKRPVGFESVLRPLRPDTTYHYMAIVYTAGGKAFGKDRSFHTPPASLH